jgi:hypothetical protein
MRVALLAAAGLCAVSCASTSAATSATPTAVQGPAPYHTAVCQAIADGKASNYSAAQSQWLAAQNASSSDITLSLDFLNLNLASASLALDSIGTSSTKATDLATYNADITELPAGTTAGC